MRRNFDESERDDPGLPLLWQQQHQPGERKALRPELALLYRRRGRVRRTEGSLLRRHEELVLREQRLQRHPGGEHRLPAGLVPVFRAYNNGFARGVDSNHRITSSQAAIADAIQRGWISEGVVMCTPS